MLRTIRLLISGNCKLASSVPNDITTGWPQCHQCGEKINPHDVEYSQDSDSFHLSKGCHAIWLNAPWTDF